MLGGANIKINCSVNVFLCIYGVYEIKTKHENVQFVN